MAGGKDTNEADSDKPLEKLLDDAEHSANGDDTVTIAALIEKFGDRGFGPLLALFGLIAATPPIGGIFGIPTTMGVLTILTAVQIIFGRKMPWVPDFIGDRGVAKSKVEKAHKKLSGIAKRVDSIIGKRLEAIAGDNMRYIVAVMCIALGAAMPALELLPFAAALPAIAIAMFGLALMARDGVLMLLALAASGGAFYLLVTNILM